MSCIDSSFNNLPEVAYLGFVMTIVKITPINPTKDRAYISNFLSHNFAPQKGQILISDGTHSKQLGHFL